MRQLRHNAAAAAFHLVGLQPEHLFPIGIRSSVSDNHILKCLHKIFDCFLAGKPGGTEAVSYTHLDVYKRQLVS